MTRRRLAAVLVGAAALVGTVVPAAGARQAPSSVATAPIRVAHTADGDVGYRVVGSGSPLVLVTGYGASLNTWSPAFLDALATRHRVYAIDNPGVGKSAPTRGALTIDSMADRVSAFVAAQRLVRPAVFGWSMGGMIAQDFAVRHRLQLGRLILAGTQTGDGRALPVPADAAAKLNSKDPKVVLSVLFPADETAAALAYAGSLRRYTEPDQFPDAVRPAQTAAVRDWIAGTYLAGHLEWTITAPTLVADGAQDALDPAPNAETLRRTILLARKHLYPDAGHAFMFQDPSAVAGDVDAFLGAGLR